MNNITLKIDESSLDEILFDIDYLIFMKEHEGFDSKKDYGLLRYLIACAKKQCGIIYKYKKGYGLIKCNKPNKNETIHNK